MVTLFAHAAQETSEGRACDRFNCECPCVGRPGEIHGHDDQEQSELLINFSSPALFDWTLATTDSRVPVARTFSKRFVFQLGQNSETKPPRDANALCRAARFSAGAAATSRSARRLRATRSSRLRGGGADTPSPLHLSRGRASSHGMSYADADVEIATPFRHGAAAGVVAAARRTREDVRSRGGRTSNTGLCRGCLFPFQTPLTRSFVVSPRATSRRW